KSSVAVGGDFGIVIVDRKSGILPLMSAWEKEETTPLPLHVYSDKRKENR
ncbi:phosphomevalonate kinase, partial [Enterococcus faecium]